MNTVLVLETVTMLLARSANVAAVLIPLIDQIRSAGASDAELDAVYEKLKTESDYIDDYLRRKPDT